jgi:hypothetical protein
MAAKGVPGEEESHRRGLRFGRRRRMLPSWQAPSAAQGQQQRGAAPVSMLVRSAIPKVC